MSSNFGYVQRTASWRASDKLKFFWLIPEKVYQSRGNVIQHIRDSESYRNAVRMFPPG